MVLSERSGSKGFMIDGRYGNQMPVYYVYNPAHTRNTLYIGVTETLDQRINTHNSGKGAEWIKAHPNAHLVLQRRSLRLPADRVLFEVGVNGAAYRRIEVGGAEAFE